MTGRSESLIARRPERRIRLALLLLLAAAWPAAAQDTTPPGPVSAVTCASGDGRTILEWTNPADADFDGVLVLRRAGAPVSDVPADGTDYLVGDTIGASTVACRTGASLESCQDTSLTNDTTYHYALFARDAALNYASSVATRGLPRDAAVFKWAVTTGTSMLAPVGAVPETFLVAVGDNQLLHRMAESDGTRGPTWDPPGVGGAVQARPMVGDLDPDADGTTDFTAFAGAQNGFLYRYSLDADGTAEASRDVAADAGCPSGMIQAAPVIMLDAFDGNANTQDDVVVVATRCGDADGDGTLNDNKVLLYSHDFQTLYDVYDGDWDLDDTADSPGLGISNAAPRILYRDNTNNLVYIPVRQDGGDDESLVVLQVKSGPEFDLPAYAELRGLGDVDAAPIVFRFGGSADYRLVFGTRDADGGGTVYLYDAVTRDGGPGSSLRFKDSFKTNDGPVKGVAVSNRVPIGVLFEYWTVWSTDTKLHGIRIQPGSGDFQDSRYWSVDVPGPSAPLVLYNVGGAGDVRAYVGAGDGTLREYDATNGSLLRTWQVETGATLGDPTFDYNDGSNQGIVVGSSSGMIHWIHLD